MRNLKIQIEEQVKELEAVIIEAEKFLDGAPPGSLRINRNKNTNQYFWRNDSKDTHGKYLNKSNKKLISDLAQKDYEQKVIRVAKKWKNELTRLLKNYDVNKLVEIYQELPLSRRMLICAHELPNEEFIAAWEQEQSFITSKHQGKNTRYKLADEQDAIITDRGEQVRSKSEKILADRFYSLGIPYKYEVPLYMTNYGYIHPDFTILNIRTRQTIYWEHLGMMDQEDYCEKAIKKIELYERNHYFVGKNLILTYETKTHPLNTRIVQKLINEFLV